VMARGGGDAVSSGASPSVVEESSWAVEESSWVVEESSWVVEESSWVVGEGSWREELQANKDSAQRREREKRSKRMGGLWVVGRPRGRALEAYLRRA
jgi:hypothetical protein